MVGAASVSKYSADTTIRLDCRLELSPCHSPLAFRLPQHSYDFAVCCESSRQSTDTLHQAIFGALQVKQYHAGVTCASIRHLASDCWTANLNHWVLKDSKLCFEQ